jgi:hypothetical protein
VLIEVSDSGVGVSDARLAEINDRLDNPPVIDVSVSRHMGLFAVARLAERHGVRVRLRPASPRGLTALVWLPDNLTERAPRAFGGWSQPVAGQADFQARQTAGRHSIAMRSATAGPSSDDWPGAVTASPQIGPGQIGTGQRETVEAADGGRPSGTDGWAEGRQAAQIIADPVRSDSTVAGLPVRIPQANLIPGSAGGGRHANGRVTSRAADSHEAQTPAAPRPQRSPDRARSRLSGFQRGTRRAEGHAPRTGEAADR